jgi:hypothetical protein
MKPFSAELWLLTDAVFFIAGGLAVYLMERRNNPRFQGHPDKQFGNVKNYSVFQLGSVIRMLLRV